MANSDHVKLVYGGAEEINKWRKDNITEILDLSGATIGMPANLVHANLSHANLDGTTFAAIDMRYADLSNASFSNKENQTQGSKLTEFQYVNLRHANFSNAKNFDSVKGLDAKQLGGVNLKGVSLPESVDIETLKSIADVSTHVKYTRNLFLTMILTCMYSWLSIWSASDLDIIANNRGLNLPIINVSLPISNFLIAIPVVIIAVYAYFLLYFQNLLERLSMAPAVFPDGKSLDEQTDPWIILSYVRFYLSGIKLNDRDIFQHFIIVILVWWLVPITLFGFWYKYMIVKSFPPIFFLIICCIFASDLSIYFYRTSKKTLTGKTISDDAPPNTINGLHIKACIFNLLLFLVLSGIKFVFPSFWSGNMQYENMSGMRLSFLDLRYANFTGADLSDANLKGSKLNSADLRAANLTNADLSGVDLSEARVSSLRWDDDAKNAAKNYSYDYWSVAERKDQDGSKIFVVVPPAEAKKPY